MMLIEMDKLVGKVFVSYEICQYKEFIKFFDCEGNCYIFYHDIECCEQVYIDDICGDLDDLLFTAILKSEMISSEMSEDELNQKEAYNEWGEWYFYKLDTIKGGVTLRWCGISTNYSTKVVIEHISN